MTRPDRFSLVLAESPVLLLEADGLNWNMTPILTGAEDLPARVYVGMGGLENIPGSGFFDPATKRHMQAAIQLAGFLDGRTEHTLNLVTHHEHNELAWAARLPAALMFLLAPASEDAEGDTEADAGANMIDPQDWPAGFTIVVEDATGEATADRPITIGTNINNWNPGDPDWVMTQRADGRWSIDIEPIASEARMELKFTLGSWDTAETNPDGSERSNRTLPEVDTSNLRQDQKPVVEYRIVRFREQAQLDRRDFADPDRPLEVTGHVERFRVAGGAGRGPRRRHSHSIVAGGLLEMS
jgi:hypothetical protein